MYTKYIMIELLVLIITILIVFISIRMHFDNKNVEVNYVLSKRDNREYLVRNLRDKDKAADLLSQIRERLLTFVSYLIKKYPNDERIIRLRDNFDPNQLSEGSSDSGYTSYSVNKGEKIVFCMRQKSEKEELMDLNTMMFVAIHELAHIMTKTVGHTDEFWENMKFLLENAILEDINIYQYQPYHDVSQEYCGTIISDTPLKI